MKVMVRRQLPQPGYAASRIHVGCPPIWEYCVGNESMAACHGLRGTSAGSSERRGRSPGRFLSQIGTTTFCLHPRNTSELDVPSSSKRFVSVNTLTGEGVG